MDCESKGSLMLNSELSMSSNRRKKKGSCLTSTPLNNNRSINKNAFDSHNSLFSIDEQLLAVFKEVVDLEKQWISGLKESSVLFTKLATQLAKTTEESNLLKNLDNLNCEMFKLVCNENGADQVGSFIEGYLIESCYDKLFKKLKSMDECTQKASILYKRLSALQKISDHSISPISCSPSNSTTQSSISDLIWWQALIGEFRGLIDRLEKDSSMRRYLISIVYSSKMNKIHLATLWNEMGLIVRWSGLLDWVNHLINLL